MAVKENPDKKKRCFHKLIETAENRRQRKYITKEAFIKLLEKKDRDKRYIKNWRPISLLNIETKILSKAFAARLESNLSSIISLNQTVYVEKSCILESGRLISDIIEICDKENIPGYLVTMGLEKAFDSLDHNFLLCALKKLGFEWALNYPFN